MTKKWSAWVLGVINLLSVVVLVFPFGWVMLHNPQLLQSLLPTVFQQQEIQQESSPVHGLLLSQQAAFRLLQDAAGRYLSLTTVAMQLFDRACSQLNDAGA